MEAQAKLVQGRELVEAVSPGCYHLSVSGGLSPSVKLTHMFLLAP